MVSNTVYQWAREPELETGRRENDAGVGYARYFVGVAENICFMASIAVHYW